MEKTKGKDKKEHTNHYTPCNRSKMQCESQSTEFETFTKDTGKCNYEAIK